MSSLQYAQDKLTSALALLIELQSTDFPYQGPLEALQHLEKPLKDRLAELAGIDPKETEPYLINLNTGYIKQATLDVTTVLEFAGYIMNSSNVRNIFEVHPPLLQMARHFIDSRQPIQLLLSFEWNYVPFTYPLNVPELPDFVVIGLPASESFNSLIIPAAGHELGHSVWLVGDYESKFYTKISDHIPELICREFWDRYEKLNPGIPKQKLKDGEKKATWNLSFQWARLQLQELFCDLIGLGLFGEAYLHTFKYIIAPSISLTRSETYPPSKQRANYLLRASEDKWQDINVPTDFLTSFEDEPAASDPEQYRLLLDIADHCTASFFTAILKEANDFLASKQHQVPHQERWKPIVADFRQFVPTSRPLGLAEILNAGWEVYHDKTFLPDLDIADEEWGKSLEHRRISKINELVLKSVEILEIESKQQGES